MNAAGAGPSGGDLPHVAAGASTASPSHPGRIVIHPRVMAKISEQVAASTLRVDRRSVTVQLTETRGGMAVTVSSPLPVPDLDDIAAIQAGATVLERVAAIQGELQETIATVTGTRVTRVNVNITGALIAQKRRVR